MPLLRFTNRRRFYRTSLFALALLLLLTVLQGGCGSGGFQAILPSISPPEQNEDDLMTPPTEDTKAAFWKQNSGTWKTACLDSTENGNSISELRTLTLGTERLTETVQLFTGASCRGTAQTTSTTQYDALIASASETQPSKLILELKNAMPQDYEPLRMRIELKAIDDFLTTRTLEMSFYERGLEVLVPDEDFASIATNEYSRESTVETLFEPARASYDALDSVPEDSDAEIENIK